MNARKNAQEELERLAGSLSRRLSGEGGGYEVSSAFSVPERRRFLGLWEVVEHLAGGEDFSAKFAKDALKGRELLEPRYEAVYRFRDGLCVKRARLLGRLGLPEGAAVWEWRIGLSLSWELEPGRVLRCRPELGYQATFLDGEPSGFRELEGPGEEVRMAYTFRKDGLLVLEEGEDRKVLRRQR